jgi:glycosyltransferase involved in cell wall biosynthesis
MEAMDAQPKLTVVVPALNAAGDIHHQLDALAAQEWDEPWEVVVADGGSTDGTRAVVERYEGRLPGLRVVDASQKRGQAYGLNAGVAAARAEAVVFCDADDEVAPGWVAAMGEALGRHELVACQSDAIKLNETWTQEMRETQAAGELSTVSFPPYSPYAGSGGLGVRREVHRRVGGFDESMPAIFDVDFCLRARAAGVELVLVPEALLHYRYRHDWRQVFRQARMYAEQMALVQSRYEDRASRPRSRRPWLLRGWKPILACLASIRRRSSRVRLAWLLGWQVGRYVGSVRNRVLAN